MTDLAHSVGVMEESFLDWVTPRRVITGMGLVFLAWILLCLALVIL